MNSDEIVYLFSLLILSKALVFFYNLSCSIRSESSYILNKAVIFRIMKLIVCNTQQITNFTITMGIINTRRRKSDATRTFAYMHTSVSIYIGIYAYAKKLAKQLHLTTAPC